MVGAKIGRASGRERSSQTSGEPATGVPSLSSAQTVNGLVWTSPALPLTGPVKVNEQLAAGARTVPAWQSASPTTAATLSSLRLAMVTDSNEVLVTVTV